MTELDFLSTILLNPSNRAILERLPQLEAPQAMLTAGCLFQTVWNVQSGRPPGEGVRDYDLFYWDADTSYAAEDAMIRRAAGLFQDLNVRLELRNQARVHLWYPQHFGLPCPPLASATAGIDRFLMTCCCVGIYAGQSVHAPHGLDDLARGLLRPNPNNIQPRLFAAKARDYQARWPWLEVSTSTTSAD